MYLACIYKRHDFFRNSIIYIDYVSANIPALRGCCNFALLLLSRGWTSLFSFSRALIRNLTAIDDGRIDRKEGGNRRIHVPLPVVP